MGAKHITPAEIKEFVRLYEKYGTYSAVGSLTKRSASTVSKHIKIYYASKIEKAEVVEEQVKQIVINL